MDNLHSIAPTSSSGGGWGLRHIAAASSTFPSPGNVGTENTPSSCIWPDIGDTDGVCSGYLQDALFNFNTKRRRLLLFGDDHDPAGNCKDLNVLWNIANLESDDDDYDYGHNINPQHCYEICDDRIPFPEMKSNGSEEEEEEAISSAAFDSRKFYHSNKRTPPSFSAGSDGGDRRPREKAMKKLAYPFAVVKPGGTEGDLTLDDINERILMPPTRPVKHPVGDFASRPLISPDGPGLSGKAVVALTRIQTRGRGTITIIRTRG